MTWHPCAGCGALVPEEDGPFHPYMTAAPACWRLYGEVMVRTHNVAVDAGLVQLRTDAYAAQHAINRDPRHQRSVAVHLMSLGAVFSCGFPPGATTRLLGRWLEQAHPFPDLTSPPPHGDITVIDVHAAADATAFAKAIHTWGRSVWSGFGQAHDEVRMLLDRVGLRPPSNSEH